MKSELSKVESISRRNVVFNRRERRNWEHGILTRLIDFYVEHSIVTVLSRLGLPNSAEDAAASSANRSARDDL